MGDSSKEMSQEYWRPAPTLGKQFHAQGFQAQGVEAFCAICGTKYAAGARFCHVCGLGREDDIHAAKHSAWMDWMDFARIRKVSGLSTVSLILVLAAAIFMMATLMTGLVYNTATIADWQAVQTWRIEWLLATVVALLGAMLFKKA